MYPVNSKLGSARALPTVLFTATNFSPSQVGVITILDILLSPSNYEFLINQMRSTQTQYFRLNLRYLVAQE